MHIENTELWNKCQWDHDPAKQQNTKSHIENALQSKYSYEWLTSCTSEARHGC